MNDIARATTADSLTTAALSRQMVSRRPELRTFWQKCHKNALWMARINRNWARKLP